MAGSEKIALDLKEELRSAEELRHPLVLANARLELNVRRISPSQLYQEATGVLLNPARQTTGLVVDEDPTTSQALPSTLSLSESLVLAWWQVSVLVGAVVVLFAGAYAIFMRQEVRA